MESVKKKEKKAYASMKERFGYKNVMSAPHLVKVIVSSGTGRASRSDKKRNDLISDRLAKITGQKPKWTAAKKSIASFKLREGEAIGQMVTLRGPHMVGFLDKLLNVALPRTRDFRGINRTIVDGMGNATIGIREHVIFPETGDEEIKDVFGLAVTVVSSAKTKEEARVFFEELGFPFKAEAAPEKGK
jgi:large subunit ribosomal protein L5